MTAPRAPLPVARAGVALATRPLQSADRARYRAEFLAELHELSPAGQLRFTAGVLSQTFALRAALGSQPNRAEEAAMTLTTTRFHWRCRVLHWHDWIQRSTEDGGRYDACARCGRDRVEYLGNGTRFGNGIGA
ncbi:hypothetical protein [Blastococcus sp. PRF04-17]|uniref:hypothetical protein n=1 Tax=Blastococcus sp. PRF04-17 TaxID=2933797 RepID=UPI001FF4BBC4|nr:hypothetical protein [Blastococcus sp. PRF04-17]UOY03758.1 hypothetical protein MVA48_10685 [Blastococcus sp. PRF04-17]